MYSTLNELLDERAETHAGVGYAYKKGDELLDFSALQTHANVFAGVLSSCFSPGQRIVLAHPSSPEFLIAFFACIKAGLIAVPAPDRQSDKRLQRLQSIVADCEPACILVEADEAQHKPFSLTVPWLTRARLIASQKSPCTDYSRFIPVPETLVMLQYTSGSTGNPKGVMLTHRNIISNLENAHRVYGLTTINQGVSWLPHYHDMGLIAGLLQPLYSHFNVEIISPMLFARQPLLWLERIDATRAGISIAPNFAFELCVQHAQQLAEFDWDLSCLRVLVNGAEPVRWKTLRDFCARFSSYGFNSQAIFPSYGLAEATLLVAAGPIDATLLQIEQSDMARLHSSSIGIGCCPAADVRVFHCETATECAEGELGEIVVSGESVTAGYWSKELTNTDLFCHVNDSGLSKRYLKTGDIGYLSKSRLYVTGRIKDMIIRHGINHYAQDIENTVALILAADNAMAVFSRNEGESEEIVLLVEQGILLPDALHARSKHIYSAVQRAHGIGIDRIVWVRSRRLPRTSSGKIQRYVLNSWLKQGRNIVREFYWASLEDTYIQTLSPKQNMGWESLSLSDKRAHLLSGFKRYLAAELDLDIDSVKSDCTLVSLGVDSVRGFRLLQPLIRDYANGARPEFIPLIFDLTLTELVDTLVAPSKNEEISFSVSESDGLLDDAQKALLLESELEGGDANILMLSLLFDSELDINRFKQALVTLSLRHPMLRACIGCEPAAPKFIVQPVISIDFTVHDERNINAAFADMNGSVAFDLDVAPLWRCIVIRQVDGQYDIRLYMHHLICDGWSLEILQRELADLYANQEALLSHEKPTNRTLDAPKAIPQKILENWQQCSNPLWPFEPKAERRYRAIKEASIVIEGDEWQQIKSALKLAETTLNLHCMATFACVLGQHFQQEKLLLAGVGHGRRNSSELETVGFYARPLIVACNTEFNPTYRRFLNRLKNALADAWSTQLAVQNEDSSLLSSSMMNYIRDVAAQGAFSFTDFTANSPWVERGVIARVHAPRSSRHILRLVIEVSPTGLVARWQYQPEKIIDEQLGLWMSQWRLGLSSLLTQADATLDCLHLGTLCKREHLLQKYGHIVELSAMQSDLLRGEWLERTSIQNCFGICLTLDGNALPTGEIYRLNDTVLSRPPIDLAREKVFLLWELAINDVLNQHPEMLWVVAEGQSMSQPRLFAVSGVAQAPLFSVKPWNDCDDSCELGNVINRLVYQSYNISTGPLIRNYFVQSEDGTWRAVFCAHHALLDAESGVRLVDEYKRRFVFLYQQWQASGNISSPTQRYSTMFHGRNDEEYSKTERDSEDTIRYWASLFLQCSSPGFPGKLTASGVETLSICYQPDRVAQLQRKCKRSGTTLANALRTLYAYAIATICRPEDGFVIDELRHGRVLQQERYGCDFFSRPAVFSTTTLLKFETLTELLNYGKSINRPYHFGVLSRRWRRRLCSNSLEFIYNFHQLSGLATGLQLLRPPIAPSQIHIVPMLCSGGLTIDVIFDGAQFPGRILLQALTRLIDCWLSGSESLGSLDWWETRNLEAPRKPLLSPSVQFDTPLYVDAWLEKAVVEWPNVRAVVDGVGEWTYGILHQKVEHTAALLINKYGIKKGQVVAVALPRCRELLVAAYGIIRAGAVYMPIPIDTPVERMQYMVEESGCRYVIVPVENERPIEFGPFTLDISVVGVDRLVADHERNQNFLPTVNRLPEDICYLLFTSGSTGRPKGVLVSHRALHNRLMWMHREYPISMGECVLHKTSIGFDVSLWELFWPAIAGATVVMASADAHRNMMQLMHDIRAFNVNVLHFVPAVLDEFLAMREIGDLSGLRWVFCSGEVLKAKSVERLYAHTGATIINLYGPTEAAIDVTHWPCQRDSSASEIPLGFAVANTEILIVDACQRIVPAGWVGEIAIAGVQLACGYLNNPDENAKRFQYVTLSGVRERVYLTGDLGCIDVDGVVHFLGRVDRQLKINGVRIEPVEIENVLLSVSGITQAAVTLIGHQLVAFIVQSPMAQLNTETVVNVDQEKLRIQSLLLNVLPASHCPHLIQIVPSLPLTTSGKIDYKKLPSLLDVVNDFYAVGEIEFRLADIWKSLLHQPIVNRNANFYQMGGHSLLIARLRSKIQEDFNVDLKLYDLFSTPDFVGQVGLIEKSSMQLVRPIEKAPAGSAHRLSMQQERLWFLHELRPNSTAYHMPLILAWRSELEIERLRSVITSMMQRHVLLRSVIVKVDGAPVWKALDTYIPPLVIHENFQRCGLADLTSREQFIEHIIQQTFDITQAPLFRVHVLAAGLGVWNIIFVFHHIIADGWTVDLLTQEFCSLFIAGADSEINQRESPSKSCLSFDYFDYVYWQRGHTREQSEALAYWVDKLTCAEPIPLPYVPVGVVSECARVIKVKEFLPSQCAENLYQLAHKHGTTLNTVLFLALQIWQAKLTGTYRNVLGTIISARPAGSFERVVGFFANTLPVTTELSPAMSINAAIVQLSKSIADWIHHSQSSFADILQNSNARMSESSLFDVLFVMEPPQTMASALPANCEVLESPALEPKYPVVLSSSVTKAGIALCWDFSNAYFTQEEANRFSAYFQRVLQQMMDGTHQFIAEVTLLKPVDAYQLRRMGEGASIGTTFPFDLGRLAMQLQSAAMHYSAKSAVRFAGDTLSYQQLLELSDVWRNVFSAFRIKPGMRVGVLLRRGLTYASALWSIFWHELCYVPLNPDDPAKRHEWVIQDAQLQLLIVDDAFLDQFEEGAFTETTRVVVNFCVGSCSVVGLVRPQLDDYHPEHRYIVYTSGSTGQPKGVLMAEPTLVNLLYWQLEHSAANSEWRTLHYSTQGFDVALQEALSTWLSGGELVLIPDAERRNSESVLNLLCDEKIQRVFMPDTALQSLALTAIRLQKFPTSLVEVITAGERLQNTASLRKFFDSLPNAQLTNQYGPAESHVVTANVLPKAASCWPISPAIGKPVWAAQLLVLDQDQKPLPIGIPGELYIGRTLAEGYWQQASLTAEKFVTLTIDGELRRYYRTGDRVCLNPSGDFEFLGRIDQQIKRNGYRIEPQEIETALIDIDEVNDALVVLENHVEFASLVAYLLLNTDAEYPRAEFHKVVGRVRATLETRLPRQLIPDRWVCVRQLPQSVNGKKIRRSVPADMWLCSNSIEGETPVTSTEMRLAALWQSMLGEREFRRQDNFFNCGGHSLLATKLLNEIFAAFAVSFPLSKLFEHSTLSAMASLIDERVVDAQSPFLSKIQAKIDSVEGEYVIPASFQQTRLWQMPYMFQRPEVAHVPLALRINGVIDRLRLTNALSAVVRRHEALRTRFVWRNGKLWQCIQPMVSVPLEEVDASGGFSDQEIMGWVKTQACKQFALDAPTLCNVSMLKLGSADQIVMFNFHHLIMDGASIASFIRDFLWLYCAADSVVTPIVPDLQYSDYCLWQQNAVALPPSALEGPPAMPSRRVEVAPKEPDFWSGATEFCLLSSTDYRKFMDRFCRDGVTATHALLALFHRVLAVTTQTAVSTVAIPVSHRHHPGTESIVGLFADSVPCTVTVEPQDFFEHLIKKTQHACLSALSQQELLLKEGLYTDIPKVIPTLFQWVSSTTMQDSNAVLDALGWQVKRISIDLGVSGRALTLQITETDTDIYAVMLYQHARYTPDSVQQILSNFRLQLGALAWDVINEEQSA